MSGDCPIPAGPKTEKMVSSIAATVGRLLGVISAAAAVWGIVIAGFLYWPPSMSLRHADAVVVLSGDHGERLSHALVLLQQGVASTLVLDGAPDLLQDLQLCAGTGAGAPRFEVICLRPQPDSTAAEARAAAKLSVARGWKALVVVTTDDHVLRTRMRFRRCFNGHLSVQGEPLPAGTSLERQTMVHEWFGTVSATLLDRGC